MRTFTVDPTPAVTPVAKVALLIATVLVGLSAGFFFTYEASVTLGLAQVGDQAYVETFQAINDTVQNPAFAIVFFGSIPAMLAAIVLHWRQGSVAGRTLLVGALVLYLTGLVVTVTGNVPLNTDLAEVTGSTPAEMSAARLAFENDWNRLNLIRSFAIGSAFAALASALLLVPGRTIDPTANRAGNSVGESESGRAMGQNR